MIDIDRIDDYILDRLSETDRKRFEEEMSSDVELRCEYDKRREIADSVQRTAMREFLQRHASRRRWAPVFKIVYSLSAAAVIALGYVGFDRYNSQARFLSSEFNSCYAQLYVPIGKGSGSEIDDCLTRIYEGLGAGEYAAVERDILTAKALIENGMVTSMQGEDAEYNLKVLHQKSDMVDWYSALLLMKEGKVLKAKKLLRMIAESGSRYAKEAETILEDLSNNKTHTR